MEAPGGGLSVQDINGKLTGEDRGKQDEAQKATTSPGKDALQYKSSDSNGKGVAGALKKTKKIAS